MKIQQDPTVNDLLITMIRRIMVSPEQMEFMTQPCVVAQDAITGKLVGSNLAGTAYQYATLDEAWSRIIDVPLAPAPPSDIATGIRGVESSPNIAWPAFGQTPAVVTPYSGPTIAITVGQAIMALAIFGNSMIPSSASPTS